MGDKLVSVTIFHMGTLTYHIERRKNRRSRREGAFTLSELLVAIVIIAVILAFLFPLTAASRDATKQAKCLANLKQIGAAVIAFSNDHGQRTPSPPTADPFVGRDLIYIYNNVMWGQLFDGGYLSRDRSGAISVFCPAIPPDAPGGTMYGGRDIPGLISMNNYQGGYQLVGYIMRNGGADGNIADRGKGVSLVAGESSWRRAIVSDYYAHKEAYNAYPASKPSRPYHRVGWNVLYLDGSVKLMKKNILPENTSFLNYGTYFRAFDNQ